MFLSYMANQNFFRELSDKFNVCQGKAHAIIFQVTQCVVNIARDIITWPTNCEKQASAAVFYRSTRRRNVIGAIDGCHLRIQIPNHINYINYMNRKGYYSVLLQGICDHTGRFIDIFTGVPGAAHDARLLRLSDFYASFEDKMGAFKLLGDSAYISAAFENFIYTPFSDNGHLTDEERLNNIQISRGRVIIENAFGRLKCRSHRLRDIQNSRLDFQVNF